MPTHSTLTRLICAAMLLAALAGSAPSQIDHVLYISVDGLRPGTMDTLGASLAPNLFRLRREGATTGNARSDFDWTITLPNHTTQITGRGVEGAQGHGWTSNLHPDPTDTIHANKGSYVASAFDVAHDHGLTTGLYATKAKFVLFRQSYDATSGAPDQTGADDGRDKVDSYVNVADSSQVVTQLITDMQASPLGFVWLHLFEPDATGHAYGWSLDPGSLYRDAVMFVDAQLGRILDMIESDPALDGHTAIVLTADHGGSGLNHIVPDVPSHYTIPFFVWGPGIAANSDLYALNGAARQDPGAARPDYAASPQPIRNGDGANLALSLLGLPPVPGSTINPAGDLAVQGTPNQSPVAMLSADVTAGEAPLTVTFDGSASSDPDGSVAGHYWFFGDGSSAAGAQVMHTFTSVGTFETVLVVADDRGALAAETVTISTPLGRLTLDAAADSTLDASGADENLGGSTLLRLDRETADVNRCRPLVSFDLSGLPAMGRVMQATLTLECLQFEGPMDVTAHPVTKRWSEGTGSSPLSSTIGDFDVTWSNTMQGRIGNLPWTTPGGDYTSADAATGTLTAAGPVSLDVTAMVAAWHAGVRANHGVLLRAFTGGSFIENCFASRENALAGSAPKLSIVYDVPPGNSPPVVMMTPDSGPVSATDALVLTLDDADGLRDLDTFTLELRHTITWYQVFVPEYLHLFTVDADSAGRPRITWPDLGAIVNHPAVGRLSLRARLSDDAGNLTEEVRTYLPDSP